jgi:Cu/Ag efflux protein CusF
MRRTMLTAMMVVVAAGCAAQHERAEERPIAPPVAAVAKADADRGVFRAHAVQVTARVQAIDYATRLVTLRGPEGNVFEVHAGPEVKNLAQVHAGDDVVTTYYESIAITAHKAGEKEPMLETTVELSRAKPGETPAGSDVQRTTVVATVVGINRQEDTLTVKGPRGKTVTVAVQDPTKLEHLAIGDRIQLVYTEALAISVEKPGAATGEKKHSKTR